MFAGLSDKKCMYISTLTLKSHQKCTGYSQRNRGHARTSWLHRYLSVFFSLSHTPKKFWNVENILLVHKMGLLIYNFG